MFLQFGFHSAAQRSSTLVLEQFDYGVVLVSSQYVFLGSAGRITRERVVQAAGIEGVRRTEPLYYGRAGWRNPAEGLRRELMLFGLRPDARPFQRPELDRMLTRLNVLDTAIVDRKTGLGYEAYRRGTRTEVGAVELEVLDEYSHGIGFAANAGLIVSDLTFTRVIPGTSLERPTIGLVWLEEGADAQIVKARLEATLPADVGVLTRAEHLEGEIRFVMGKKPIGIIFTTGVWMAFFVGALVLYQILAAEVVNHLSEYATLKAMGYESRDVYRVVWHQAALFALFGFLPAVPLAWAVYAVIETFTTLPTRMTLSTFATVLAATMVMCLVSAILAARKVDRADPADLFG